MSYLTELQKTTNRTRTDNGAATNISTLSATLDFFSMASAMRGNLEDAVKLFSRAYGEEPLTAVRTLFYLRDIRGGQGERELFRTCLMELASIDNDAWKKVQKHVPEYGRWDDLDFNAGPIIFEMVRKQLEEDENNMKAQKSVSLLAKWLPSENASSKVTSERAKLLTTALGLKPSQYRKKIVALRKHIKVLEQQMSAKQWGDVEYSKLPSQAHRKHVKAFHRNDETRYSKFLDKAFKGEIKLNTGTLYTYEVFDAVKAGDTEAANAMWANLPDYTNDTNALVVADVSGSMTGRPMSVAVSLALYFAEHNQGPFHNAFMTFSENPHVVKVVGNSLTARLNNIENREWGYNTNMQAVFEALLRAAKANGAKVDDMPKAVYIISDMQFDQATDSPSETIFENATRKYADEGFELPHLVFWNVNANSTQAPATKFDNRVTLISGLSQSTFRYVVEGKTPEQLMQEVVNSKRYAQIEI